MNQPVTRSNVRSQSTSKDKATDSSLAAEDRPPSSSSSVGEGKTGDKQLIRNTISEFLAEDSQLDIIVERLFKKLTDRMLETVTTQVSAKFEARFEEAERKIASLTEEINVMREESAARNKLIEARNDDLAQYQRRNNIRIFGLPEEPGEDVSKIVTGFLQSKLDIKIDDAVIDRCHRVGRKPALDSAQPRQQPRPRAVLVKFISYQTKRTVLAARRKLKGKGFTVREDLTRQRNDFYREVAARVGFRNVWTVDGRVLWKEGGNIVSGSIL
jgi:hypothetical protein